ncbi:molybdenum cofactor biosynthesis protein C [Ethanoligenens harbinense YUAN-3]|uniref:Cyclic pyranopterin monophosphate synthase n=1 Tax=Ethanoligenens harbinense (strain DSM 18485 / JCM 12961 / CGMCC 1.5033 / YUAN-3) TaxID=663278 RepID=E6U679_ETHHY|nr:molybdenum cofactor biosynthesis protein C [Ethanoligenens harbinense YUAN-3]
MQKMGRVVSVNRSEVKGVVKVPVASGELRVDVGLMGDAHAGTGKRQISLLAAESIEKMQKQGAQGLVPGSFAENITTQGVELYTLPVGTRLQIGETLHVVTQIGKECHKGCAIRELVGDCVMPREGIFTNVLKGGTVRSGDAVTILPYAGDKQGDGVPVDDTPAFSHLDQDGNIRMVDVSQKDDTQRRAVAVGRIAMSPETLSAVYDGSLPKGDVLAAARIAGAMAAKKTSALIPMCHLLALHAVSVVLSRNEQEHCIDITASVSCTGKTGVEMEALTAVSVAALTIYDMCKAVDKNMEIGGIMLMEKSGGKSGQYFRSSASGPADEQKRGIPAV